MSSSSESNMDRARRRINSQKSASSRNEGQLDHGKADEMQRRFGHSEPPKGSQPDPEPEPEDDGGSSFLNKLLAFSILFCLVAFAVAYLTVGVGDGGVSPDKVNISVSGPRSISAGEAIDLLVSITNGNEVPLEQAELVVDYPAGTQSTRNDGEELTRQRIDIGDIAAGEALQKNLPATLFGEQGEIREVDVELEYHVAESNAIFTASGQYSAEVTSSPISLSIRGPESVTLGEEVTLTVVIRSNSSQTINDLVLAADYPFGFEVSTIEPKADFRNFIWQLGDLAPGDEETYTITGVFSDTNAENQQAFNARVGTARIGDATEIGTLFATDTLLSQLDEPFIMLDLALSSDSSGRSDRGIAILGEVNYRSTVSSVLRGVGATAQFSGEAINFSTINSREGLYQADEQSVLWNSQTTPAFSSLSAGQNGRLEFELQTISPTELASLAENPTVSISLEMSGQAPDSSTLPNPVTASIRKNLSIPTFISLTADTLHEDGPFNNDGPTPPEVGEETGYTLHLSLSNTTNNIEGAELSAALPAYVELAGGVSPAGADFSFNEVSGRVSWEIGDISAGAGYSRAPVELFIPVEITPNQNQVGQTLRLLEDISITGTDTSSGELIERTGLKVPTTQLDDLRADYNSGAVEEG